ncbi:DNA polymerase eta [Lotmaria passim]
MRCIAHLDMDCFYAQVEAVRLGIDCRTVPLVLSQWDCPIAVNYPARSYGIKRGQHSTTEAKELCPDLVVALSPSYKKGEFVSKYHPNPIRDQYKISLEPYRLASRKFFAILASEHGVQVEKGGVDEAYLDVTEAAQLELDQLRATTAASTGADLDLLDPLTAVLEPSTHLIADRRAEMAAWFAERGTSLAEIFDAPMAALLRGERGRGVDGSRGFCVSADDACYAERCRLLCAASRVVARLRRRLYAELHYDCSAGIAHNRVLAKCISATHKPNQQTLLLPDRSASALFDLPLRRLRGFGGKFGAAVSALCGGATDCRELWLVPLSQLYALDGGAVVVVKGEGHCRDDDSDSDMSEGGGKEKEKGSGTTDGGWTRRYEGTITVRKPPSSSGTARCFAKKRGGCHDVRDSDASVDHVKHDTSLYAYFRVRGLAEDTVANQPLSKSLIASKQFGHLTRSVDAVQEWVVVLCAELCSRYDEFTSLYHLRGRSWNIKVGNEGFRQMGGVMNRTVPLPEAVVPDILAAVTYRQLQTLFQNGRSSVTADSVTLTIGGFVSDNSGGAGVVPSLVAVAGARPHRVPPRQQTLHSFFPARLGSTPSSTHTAVKMEAGADDKELVPAEEQISDDDDHGVDDSGSDTQSSIGCCGAVEDDVGAVVCSSDSDCVEEKKTGKGDGDGAVSLSSSLSSLRHRAHLPFINSSCVSPVQVASTPPSPASCDVVSEGGSVKSEERCKAKSKHATPASQPARLPFSVVVADRREREWVDSKGAVRPSAHSLDRFYRRVREASSDLTRAASHKSKQPLASAAAVLVEEDVVEVDVVDDCLADGECCRSSSDCEMTSTPAVKRIKKEEETVIID